jgi:pimeloyl-ACP methyl ester carboxylesterase
MSLDWTAAELKLLPSGVSDVFRHEVHIIESVEYHVVIGGSGPALLLIPGWPQSWMTWRNMIAPLAQLGFTVVVVDPKGVGQSSHVDGGELGQGYDTGAVGSELTKLMRALGFSRFAVAGHDIGMWIAYAMAADHSDAVSHLIVADAMIPGIGPSPPLLSPAAGIKRMWHFAFNRASDAILSKIFSTPGSEREYLNWQFETKAGHPNLLPQDVRDHYIAANTGRNGKAHAALGYYRAIDKTIAQNEQRKLHKLKMPTLALGGSMGAGGRTVSDMQLVSADPVCVILPDTGHYIPDEAPNRFVEEMKAFFKLFPLL